MVAADVGSTDDPQALAFWQSSDVLGFSDYQRLFMFLEHADAAEQEAGMQKRRMMVSLIKEHFDAFCHVHIAFVEASRSKQMQHFHVFVLEAVEQAKELAARFALTA